MVMRKLVLLSILALTFEFSNSFADNLSINVVDQGLPAALDNDGWENRTTGGVCSNQEPCTYVELRYDYNRWGGAFRFHNVTIPECSTINSAYVSLALGFTFMPYAYDSIACQDVDSAISLTTDAYNISSRWTNRTTAFVWWYETVKHDAVAQRDSTPDLKSMVQEIVDRPGWKSGNSMMFLFKQGSDPYDYEVYACDHPDSDHSLGAILCVDYTPAVEDTFTLLRIKDDWRFKPSFIMDWRFQDSITVSVAQVQKIFHGGANGMDTMYTNGAVQNIYK